MPLDNKNRTPQYGIDAPGVIRGFYLIGLSILIVAWCIISAHILGTYSWLLGGLLTLPALVMLSLGTSMMLYAVHGKFRMRECILGLVNWKGDEQVLDIGTGRGLLMIGCAKRLNTGKSIGIDIWNAADLSGNRIENAAFNAEIEGVKDKVELKTEDIRKTSFADHSFDVIVSLLCLHNIEDAKEREASCHEIARILKPGAKALIADYVPTHSYAKVFSEAGLVVQSSKSYFTTTYALMWMVIATKKEEIV